MTDSLAEHYLKDALRVFRSQKKLADGAIAQVSDEELFQTIDAESNSIALIMKHLAGNMRSRWTDFLTSDGEKPDRQRDSEFVIGSADRRTIMESWEEGWRTVFDTIESLRPEDIDRTVTIRGEPHTIVEAVNRQLSHYGQHTGQIVFLAKHLKSSDWKTLSIPRGGSQDFNSKMDEGQR
jgi:hypothetical protein